MLLDVSLGLKRVKKPMLHLGFLSILALLVYLGQWRQLRIMLKIVLPWHDGG